VAPTRFPQALYAALFDDDLDAVAASKHEKYRLPVVTVGSNGGGGGI
jgi:hypothetical protein